MTHTRRSQEVTAPPSEQRVVGPSVVYQWTRVRPVCVDAALCFLVGHKGFLWRRCDIQGSEVGGSKRWFTGRRSERDVYNSSWGGKVRGRLGPFDPGSLTVTGGGAQLSLDVSLSLYGPVYVTLTDK